MIGSLSYHFHQGPDLARPRPLSQPKEPKVQTVLTYAVTVPIPVSVTAPVVYVQWLTVPSSSSLIFQSGRAGGQFRLI